MEQPATRVVSRRAFLISSLGALAALTLSSCSQPAAPAAAPTSASAGAAPTAAAGGAPTAAAGAAPTVPSANPTAAPAVAEPTAGAAAAAGAKADLDFVVWAYKLEIIEDNIKKFQELNPGATVKLHDVGWSTYHEGMVQRFRSNTPTDVIYNGGDWLGEFAKAGWVVPLEDHFPWVQGYKDKVFGFAWQDMVYDGKVYGLPYYADTITFMYNEKILKDAGISKPPETWEEVTDQSKSLKTKGLEHPFLWVLAQDLPTVTETYVSTVFGRGGELIDEKSNALWSDPASDAAQQFTWLADARNKDQILTFVPNETDAVASMQAGRHAFTVLYNYHLAELNNKALSDRAGQFKIGMMPGKTHECYGFSKFYNMTKMAVDRGPEVVDASGKFIQYFGGETDGKYVVAKRWAIDAGIGFGQKPMMDDPEVTKSFAEWIDIDQWRKQLDLARAQRHTPWYGIWGEFMRLQHVKAVNGESSSEEALQAMTEKWDQLKKQFENA